MKAQIRGLVPTKMFPKITSLHTFVLAVLFLTTALTGRASPVSFRSEIAPLLLAQCQGCHGAEKAKGDYRVDSYTELMRALEEEPPRVQAGKPAASLILQLLSSEEADDRMPQKSAPLGARQIELVRRWIGEGASFDGDDPDAALRPKTLQEFIGQEAARENLGVFIAAAKTRGEAMDHTLFFGPPGLGKTTLAQIVARELGAGFRSTSGPVIAKAGDLAALLTNLEPHDVLFIDEIHRLNPVVEEVLYPAMEDRALDIMIGEGPSARSVRIDLPPFTLIGATTRQGLLTTPLRDRFGIPVRLNFYTHEELERVVTRGANKLGLSIEPDGAREIARRSRGTPRVAGRLLRRVRDFASVDNAPSITAQVADSALTKLEVDSLGLDAMDRRYLTMIAETYGGGPVGIETLAAGLAEPRDTLEDVVEPFLIQLGLVARTARGRCLNAGGWQHLGLEAPKGPSPDLFAGKS